MIIPPGLFASEAFQSLIWEKKASLIADDELRPIPSWNKPNSLVNEQKTASHHIIQLAEAMSVIRELFLFFDDAKNGYIDLSTIEMMQKHVGLVMVEVLLHGAQR